MKAIALLIPFVATPILAASVAAQSDEAADTFPAYRLEGVTVTSTRTAVSTDRLPQRIDVIDSAQITRSGAYTVAGALRNTVALDIIEFPGLLAGVSVRGFRPQYSTSNPRTLVLVDGRPAGTNNVALLETAGVERIEVLRGPASALYGPNAMGGVINVVRRRSTGGISGRASLGYGSFGAYRGLLTAGGDLAGNVDFDISVSTTGQRNGYRTGSHRSLGSDSLLKTLPDGETVRLPWSTADTTLEFSRFATRNVSGRVGLQFSRRWRMDLDVRDYRAEDVENPGDLNVTDYDSRTLKDAVRTGADLSLSGTPGGHRTTVRIYHADETVDYYNGPETPHFINFRTPVRTYGGQFQNAFTLGPADLIVGTDVTLSETRSERFDESAQRIAPFSPDSRIWATALFGEARADVLAGLATLSTGLRYDRVRFDILETPHLGSSVPNRERRGVVTPTAGVRLRPSAAVRFYANAGRAFVSPDPFFVAGYSESRAGEGRSVHVTRGNPHLDPERSRTWDAGISVLRPDIGLEADLAYFDTRVRGRIASLVTPGTGVELTPAGDTIVSTTSYVNVDEADIEGVEARLSLDLGRLLRQPHPVRLFLNGTRIIRAEERFVDAAARRRIQNVASRTWIGGIDVARVGPVGGRLTARYVADRVDADYVAWWAPGEISYPPYVVLDLHLATHLGDRYRFTVDLRNLGDEDYFEVRGYNLPGRSLNLGVSAAF